MAPPPKSGPRPWRPLAVLGALLVIMLLGIVGGNLFSPGKWQSDFRVGLGLDLSSGSQITMIATTPSGGVPSQDVMNATISIITSRVNGTGNTGATVQQQGNDIITVSVPGKTGPELVKLVSSTSLLRFRQVLLYSASGNATESASATPTASASASPSASASASPSATASASTQATASPDATANASASAHATAAATASPHATGTASSHASSSASASPSASASASASPSPSASSGTGVVYGDQTKVSKSVLALFNKLDCKPGDSTDTWKQQVGYLNSSQWDDPNAQIVSCDTTTGEKYVLDKAKVLGEDVTGATATLNATTNGWEVDLTFNGAGSNAFGNLTTYLYNTYYSQASSSQDDAVLDQVAIVLDGDVVSAPEIQGAITGTATISGSFTQQQATNLQDILKYGALKVKLNPQSVTSVSATLGSAQLDGGLIAGAIGLILVVVYSFLYYRGMSLISISSLSVAALLGYLTIVLLTKYQSYTLSLAGIAGLIVAIGITADSFVVFFERLRDEVRDGKSLRPAVEAGWKRARRTILVSDTVSFLAALLLYYFAISDVKGFAYTLGLTTIIDVVVVFLFTKPLMTIAARSKFFGNGHPLSGLDPKRLGARTPWRGSSVRVTRTQGRGTQARGTQSRPGSSRTRGGNTTGEA